MYIDNIGFRLHKITGPGYDRLRDRWFTCRTRKETLRLFRLWRNYWFHYWTDLPG